MLKGTNMSVKFREKTKKKEYDIYTNIEPHKNAVTPVQNLWQQMSPSVFQQVTLLPQAY
jgi:hypothetical protein